MKAIFFSICLFLSIGAFGQTTVVSIGTAGYVTIDGQNYNRNNLATYYSVSRGDSTLQVQLPNGIIPGKICTLYLDGDNGNTPFATMPELHAWWNANGEPTGGSGSSCLSSCTLTAEPTVSGASLYGVSFADLTGFLISTGDIVTQQLPDGYRVGRNHGATFINVDTATQTTFNGYDTHGITYDALNQAIILSEADIPEFADDAAAITATRPIGSIYRTTSGGSTILKMVPTY